MNVPHAYEWIHAVLNFIGTNDEEVIRIYNNGVQVTNEEIGQTNRTQSTSDGRIVIGRLYTNEDEDSDYASVQVDELLFFNQTLTEPEIAMLSKITG